MSMIIARHLVKSGNNNIAFRIGNFNKFSSLKIAKTKKISKLVTQSKYYDNMQKKLTLGRQHNILNNIYTTIDSNMSRKMLSNYSDPKINDTINTMWVTNYAREIINTFKIPFNIAKKNHYCKNIDSFTFKDHRN